VSAALKCRQRKKAWLASLQTKVEFLQNENERLTLQLVASREEISRLGALVGAAAPGPQPAGANGAPVSVNVSMAKVGGGARGGGGGGGGGYGY
jgi:ATF/CREB family transcription factor